MLPKSSKKVLITWLNLLENFQEIISEEKVDFSSVKKQWDRISDYLQSHIVPINCDNISGVNKFSWQTWQTETYRYVRLLNTEILFWRSSKQVQTKLDRFLNIKKKLEEMIQLTNHLL